MKRHRSVNLDSLTGYQLGILWAIATYEPSDGGYMLFRHRERYFLEQIQSVSGNAIQLSRSMTGPQYRLKMFGYSLADLGSWGWTARNAETRDIPPLDDYRDFLRAWLEIHSNIDYSPFPGNKFLKKIRYRIYGNFIMMESVSRILSEYAGVGRKKPQPCANYGKTCAIYYQSPAEIEKIFAYVAGQPCFEAYWDKAYQKLKEPVIEKSPAAK